MSRLRQRLLLTLGLALAGSSAVFAQADGDYQSRATGNWFSATTWQVFNNGGWWDLDDATPGHADLYLNQIPSDPPSNGQPIGEITILSPHIITVNSGAAALSLVTNPLYVRAGAQMIISNTAFDPDINVDPSSTVLVEGLLALSNGATHAGFDDPSVTTIANGGVYEHRYTTTPGQIILATWDDGSTIRFTNYTSAATFNGTENLNQDYYDFEWSCPQTGSIDLNGNLVSVRHNLSILSTDTGAASPDRLRIFGNSDNNTLSIGGDFIVSGASSVVFTTNGTGNTIDVVGNYSNSTNTTMRTTFVLGPGSLIFNIGGNYLNAPAAAVATRFTANAGAQVDVNLTGNFASGLETMSATVGSSANLNFVGNGPVQTATGTGTVTGPVNYFVEGTSILDMGTSSLRASTGAFTLRSSATLRVGAFNGSGTNANGAIQTGTTQGNIRVGGVRTYEDESTIIYNGAAAQQMGNGHPSATIVNTIINNSAGVTTVGSRTISGDLTLQSGNLNAAAAAVLTLNRDIIQNTNHITTTATSDFVINGSGLTGTFPFPAGAQTIRNFTLNRTSGSLTFANQVTITAICTLTDGDLIFNGQTLILNGTFVSTAGDLSGSATSTLQIGGTGAFGTLTFTPGGSIVGTLTYNRAASGLATLGDPLNVTTTFNLNNGNFGNPTNNLILSTISTPATIFRTSTTAVLQTTVPSTLSTYNVSYSGTGLTTGLELPDALDFVSLRDLTIAGSGTKTLNQDVTINGNFSFTAGTFTPGANTITMNGAAWNQNAGTTFTNTSGSTVVFGGTTTIGGTGTPAFENFSVNNGASVTMPAGTVNIAGNVQISSGCTFNSTGTILLNGATSTNFAGGGKSFANITLNKTASSDVTLTGGTNITGILTVTSAGSDFNSTASGFLTLVSTASNTGVIAALSSATRTVSGTVNVQRFMQAKGRFYRDIGSPVFSATAPAVKDITDSGITITGPFTGSSFPCAGCSTNGASMFYYDETVAGLQTLGYVGYPTSGSNSATTYLARGRGYNVLIRNELGSPTMTLKGPINSAAGGAIALPVSYTTTAGGVTEDGWNFVANPLPCSIDWDAAAWTKTNIQGNQISVYDPSFGGYRVWNGATGSLGNGRIAPGQGFWVKLSAAGALSITNETVKTTTLGTFYRTEQTVSNLELILADNHSTDEDRAYLELNRNALSSFDGSDGMKWKNDFFNLTTLSSDAVPLSINALGAVSKGDRIPVQLTDVVAGSYKFTVNQFGDFQNFDVFLHDKFRNETVRLSGSDGYSFEVTAAAATAPRDRFYLVFEGKDEVASNVLAPSRVRIYPNPVKDRVVVIVSEQNVREEADVIDNMGMTVGTIILKQEQDQWTGSLDLSDKTSGIYFVRVVTDKGPTVFKILKQ